MGKSSPQMPPTPDPNQLINAQANANRITQYTPFGNLLFGSVGDQGQFVQGSVPEDGQAAAFTQETPFQAQMRAAQEGTSLALGNVAYNRLNGQPLGLNLQQGPSSTDFFGNTLPVASGSGPIGGGLFGDNMSLKAYTGGSSTFDESAPYDPGQLGISPPGSRLQTDFQPLLKSSLSSQGPSSTDFLGNTLPVASGGGTAEQAYAQAQQDARQQQQSKNLNNPFESAPTLAGVNQAQDIDPTTGLPAFQSNINTGQAIPQGINTAGLTALTNDPVSLRSNIEQTLFDRQLGLLQPEFTRQSQELQQNLANRGIPITSQAFSDATNRLQAQQGEQRQRLAQQATLAAGQESDRIVNQARNIRAQQFGERAAAGEFGLASQGQGFSQAAANAQLANAARQDTVANQLLSNQIANQRRARQIAERNALRGQNFNELAALLGGQQIQQPSFFAPGSIDTQGAFGMAQQAQQNAFNQAQASRQANLGGLFGLAGNLGSAYLLR